MLAATAEQRGEGNIPESSQNLIHEVEQHKEKYPVDHKLRFFNYNLSPYCARTRAVIYWKQLENTVIQIEEPPKNGTRSPEYLNINPVGKVPALILEDGRVIIESDVISEYLIEKYADKGTNLSPSSLDETIKSRLIARLNDLYLWPATMNLWKAHYEVIKWLTYPKLMFDVSEIHKQLHILEKFIGSPFAAGETRSIADASLIPTFFFLETYLVRVDAKAFDAHPRVAAWWNNLKKDEVVTIVSNEIQTAITKFLP